MLIALYASDLDIPFANPQRDVTAIFNRICVKHDKLLSLRLTQADRNRGIELYAHVRKNCFRTLIFRLFLSMD